MPKELNVISRLGNKENDIKYFSHLLPLDVKTVVEPFAGSFAVSKFFYKDPNQYKFHINDKNEVLFLGREKKEVLKEIKKFIRNRKRNNLEFKLIP